MLDLMANAQRRVIEREYFQGHATTHCARCGDKKQYVQAHTHAYHLYEHMHTYSSEQELLTYYDAEMLYAVEMMMAVCLVHI